MRHTVPSVCDLTNVEDAAGDHVQHWNGSHVSTKGYLLQKENTSTVPLRCWYDCPLPLEPSSKTIYSSS